METVRPVLRPEGSRRARRVRPGLTALAAGTVFALAASAGVVVAAPAGADPAGLTVEDLTTGASAETMAQRLAGAGVSISNVRYTGADRAAGTFTSSDPSTLGFGSGVVLDSGKVRTASDDIECARGVEGPNRCYEPGGSNSTGFGLPGDADLDALTPSGTADAAVLEFDFVPQFGTVQFSYVFSSDEYNTFANSRFDDVFGFFVNGSNCALVPGTTDPVSINTINNGNPQGDATPHHPELFRDNVRPDGPTIDTEMDGLTTVLTCDATVAAGQRNHLKLAIADAGDSALDSAVFLRAGSLVSGTAVTTTLAGGGKSGASISVPAGTAVTDTASLSGANAATATGTVSYRVFSDSACATQVADAGTVPVTNGAVPSSAPVTQTTPGDYYWQAFYSGDQSNNAAASGCGDEILTVTAAEPPVCAAGPTPVLDLMASADATTARSVYTTPRFGTAGGNELLLAFIEADGPSAPTQIVRNVSGGGLTWTLAKRSNRTWGTTEVWQAVAGTQLKNVRVSAKLRYAYDGSITVAAFKGAAAAVGAAVGAAGTSGQPQATITPSSCGSLVWAAGHDWTDSPSPSPSAGTTFAHLFDDTRVNDSFWTQSVNSPTGTDPVTVAVTGPTTDRWTYAVVEIPPAAR